MAEMLSKPQVEDSISVVSPKHSDLNLVLDEISFEGLTKYDGIKIKKSQIREEFDIIIVGVIKSTGESIINPSPETILSSKDLVLLLGEASKLEKFKETLPGK